MMSLCLDCYNLICEEAGVLPEDLPQVPVLENGVCPKCQGTRIKDLSELAMELAE